jgi:hypothetical protein
MSRERRRNRKANGGGGGRRERYWVAVNGASVALCSFALESVECKPTPERLFGFSTLREAREAQTFLLNAPIPDCARRMREWYERHDVHLVEPPDPEPPTRGPTLWLSGGKPVTEEGSAPEEPADYRPVKVCVAYRHPEEGTLLLCVEVGFPAGQEPSVDLLRAKRFAGDAKLGDISKYVWPNPPRRKLLTGDKVALTVGKELPEATGTVGQVVWLPLVLGMSKPGQPDD